MAQQSEDNVLGEMLDAITTLMVNFPVALERRATEIDVSGKAPELVGKLMKGADAMRDSGNLYLTWARHYTALSTGTSDAAVEEDEPDFGY